MANQPAADDLPLSLRFFSPSLSYALFFLSSLLLKQIYRVATFFFLWDSSFRLFRYSHGFRPCHSFLAAHANVSKEREARAETIINRAAAKKKRQVKEKESKKCRSKAPPKKVRRISVFMSAAVDLMLLLRSFFVLVVSKC